MKFFENFWGNAHDVCIDATDPVAEATNIMYDTLAGRVPFVPDHIADQIGDAVGGIVHENWEHVCDLPSNLSNDFSNLANSFGYGDINTPHQDLLDVGYDSNTHIAEYAFGNDTTTDIQFEYADLTCNQPFDDSLCVLPDTTTSTQFEHADIPSCQPLDEGLCVPDAIDSHSAGYSDTENAASADSD